MFIFLRFYLVDWGQHKLKGDSSILSLKRQANFKKKHQWKYSKLNVNDEWRIKSGLTRVAFTKEKFVPK